MAKIGRPKELTPEQEDIFFDTIADGCHVGRACEAAGVTRTCVWYWRRDRPDFAKRWEEAMKVGVSKLEDIAHERAFDGVKEPLHDKGKLTGDTIKKYSDVLAIFLLKAHAPEKYRERTSMELTGANGGPVEFSDLQLAARMAAIATSAEREAEDVPKGDDGEPLL